MHCNPYFVKKRLYFGLSMWQKFEGRMPLRLDLGKQLNDSALKCCIKRRNLGLKSSKLHATRG